MISIIGKKSHSKDWKKFEQDNKTIALNILFVPHSTKQIRHAYKSKHNFKREDQVILLMIIDGAKWLSLAVKILSTLLRRITSNHNRDFYCLNCFHSYSTNEKLEKHENVCSDHDYCYVEMPNNNKILKYNHGEKSMRAPFVIYPELECLLEKMHSCQNNLEKSYTEKKIKHTPSRYSLFTNCAFDETKSELDCYKGDDCMERFCKDLGEHATKIINYEEKEMILLTGEENKSYKKQKVCYIWKREFSTDKNDKNFFKLYHKVRGHCHYTRKFRGVAHGIFSLRYKTPKEIPVVFHNGLHLITTL